MESACKNKTNSLISTFRIIRIKPIFSSLSVRLRLHIYPITIVKLIADEGRLSDPFYHRPFFSSLQRVLQLQGDHPHQQSPCQFYIHTAALNQISRKPFETLSYRTQQGRVYFRSILFQVWNVFQIQIWNYPTHRS